MRRIPIDPVGSGVNDIIPGLGVDTSTSGSHAHLALAFYYFPNAGCFTFNCQLDVGFVSSKNGGTSWSAKKQLAGPMNLTWLADTTSGFMVGDYISASIVHGIAFPMFAIAHAPSGELLDEAMYTTPEALLTIEGGTLTSNEDQALGCHWLSLGEVCRTCWPLVA